MGRSPHRLMLRPPRRPISLGRRAASKRARPYNAPPPPPSPSPGRSIAIGAPRRPLGGGRGPDLGRGRGVRSGAAGGSGAVPGGQGFRAPLPPEAVRLERTKGLVGSFSGLTCIDTPTSKQRCLPRHLTRAGHGPPRLYGHARPGALLLRGFCVTAAGRLGSSAVFQALGLSCRFDRRVKAKRPWRVRLVRARAIIHMYLIPWSGRSDARLPLQLA